ncbi:MAG TPA: hypothetical protein VIC26_08890 [Marinagarivorans sp.]
MSNTLTTTLRRGTLALAFGITSATLSGCETSGAMVDASRQGFGAFSCDQIYNTFNAYDRDKMSIDAAKELSASIGIPYTGGSGAKYFDTAKSSANIALSAQGCNPL